MESKHRRRSLRLRDRSLSASREKDVSSGMDEKATGDGALKQFSRNASQSRHHKRKASDLSTAGSYMDSAIDDSGSTSSSISGPPSIVDGDDTSLMVAPRISFDYSVNLEPLRSSAVKMSKQIDPRARLGLTSANAGQDSLDYRDYDEASEVATTSASYDTVQGWASGGRSDVTASSSHLSRKRSSSKRSNVGWKPIDAEERSESGSARRNPGRSPFIADMTTLSPQRIVRTRSGRVVKPVSRSGTMSSRVKRTRSDPLPLLRRRASTPLSASHLQSQCQPERPQSAMKHKSANLYSQGKEGLIVTSSSHMPVVEDSLERSPFLEMVRRRRKETNSRPVTVTQPDNDPDAFSPMQHNRLSSALYVLRSRPSLPQTDFYQRTKREEGSPTPTARHLTL